MGAQGSEKGPDLYEEPNIKSLVYAYKVELRVRLREGTVMSMR